jgi:WD40 repeat protein
VRARKTRGGKPLQHEAEVISAAFDAKGERIVTASADKTARIWDAHGRADRQAAAA